MVPEEREGAREEAARGWARHCFHPFFAFPSITRRVQLPIKENFCPYASISSRGLSASRRQGISRVEDQIWKERRTSTPTTADKRLHTEHASPTEFSVQALSFSWSHSCLPPRLWRSYFLLRVVSPVIAASCPFHCGL